MIHGENVPCPTNWTMPACGPDHENLLALRATQIPAVDAVALTEEDAAVDDRVVDRMVVTGRAVADPRVPLEQEKGTGLPCRNPTFTPVV